VEMNTRTGGGEVRLELDQRGPVQSAKGNDIWVHPVKAEDDVSNGLCRFDEPRNRRECEVVRIFG